MSFVSLLRDHRGVSAAEYAILLGLVGSAVALAAIGLGGSIAGSMNDSRGCVQNHGKSCGKGNAHQGNPSQPDLPPQAQPPHPDHPAHPPHP
jgi:pilus assembly protein Flp/PilA